MTDGYPGYTRIGWAATKDKKQIGYALLVDKSFRPKMVPYAEYIARNPQDKPGDDYLDALNTPAEPGKITVVEV